MNWSSLGEVRVVNQSISTEIVQAGCAGASDQLGQSGPGGKQNINLKARGFLLKRRPGSIGARL